MRVSKKVKVESGKLKVESNTLSDAVGVAQCIVFVCI
jgi:hypothetical protein